MVTSCSRVLKAAFVALCVVTFMVVQEEPVRAYTWTYCNGSNGDPDADPYDSVSDTDALNDCLDMYDIVYLENDNGGGYEGYIIDNVGPFNAPRAWGCLDQDPDPYVEECYAGVEMGTYNMLLPAGSGGKPRLVAAVGLIAPVVAADSGGAYSYEIHGIAFDGERDSRTAFADCDGYRGWASNVVLRGSQVQVIEIDSYETLCGSSLELNDVEDYEVTTSYLGDNGYEEGTYGVGDEPWADGLTLNGTVSGGVYYNQFANNTDIGTVVRDGSEVYFAHNEIWNDSAYAFGGLHIQKCEDGCQTWDNDVEGGYNLLAFGIVLGQHPWNTGSEGDVGEVYENSIEGAVINLAIDGIDDGWIHGNVLSNAQGSNGFGTCTTSAEFSAEHYGSATITSGGGQPSPSESLHWSGGSCS